MFKDDKILLKMSFSYNYKNPILIEEKELIIPPLGFHNTGSICYFNSLIQCLLSSKNFLKFILYDKEDPMFIEFLKNIINDSWDMVFTTRLLQTHNIVNGNQSSSEYFIILVDLLKLENIFECHHIIKSICRNCGHSKQSKDISYCTLINDNIKEFFNFIDSVDNVICDNCKNRSTFDREKIINGIPPVIVLSFNKYFGKRNISYPPYFSNNVVEYKLVGSVEHFGVLGAGHYIARMNRNGKYYIADDSRVSDIADINPIDETYMAFYERVK
jgi:ubiquitin C-terminal hydrolase